MDQFVTRFLLRETVSQLQALQSSLEGASDTLEAQAQAQAQARGPWYVRSSADLQVQFMNTHYLHTPSPLAFLTLRSFHRLEPKFLCWGREAKKVGETGWL